MLGRLLPMHGALLLEMRASYVSSSMWISKHVIYIAAVIEANSPRRFARDFLAMNRAKTRWLVVILALQVKPN